MKYYKICRLKDGRNCVLRNGTEEDGRMALDLFIRTHEQTDYLLTYGDEIKYTVEEESNYLREKTDSPDECEICAEVDGKIVGLAGIGREGEQDKIRHRADFGVSVDKEYWGLGIGRAMLKACVECAKIAGYEQLELNAVAENERAVKLYDSEGFVEYGRNPKGFKSRITGWQEVVLMRLELK